MTSDRPGPAPRFTEPQVRERILQALAAGTSWKAAADHARVARPTIFAWKARGEAAAALEDAGEPVPPEEQQYLDWWREMLAARSDATVRAVGLVHRHAETDPTSARWLAERLDRERYRLEQRLEMTGDGGGPVQVQHAHVDRQHEQRERPVPAQKAARVDAEAAGHRQVHAGER